MKKKDLIRTFQNDLPNDLRDIGKSGIDNEIVISKKKLGYKPIKGHYIKDLYDIYTIQILHS